MSDGLINIPREFWHRTIIVKSRENFINSLKKGKIGEFYFVSQIPPQTLNTTYKKWQTIRFGLNCILSY